MNSDKAVLLYDGECGFCSAVVQLVLRHETRHTLKFAALQSRFGAAVVARHPTLRNVDSVVWFEPEQGGKLEQVFVRSEAALRVAEYLGGWWRLTTAAQLVPRRLRDAAYDLVARHRRQLPGFPQACLLPGPPVRERFVEQ
jgi:predicted DCC family thiol-disulfide oxidoreductase YuxK